MGREREQVKIGAPLFLAFRPHRNRCGYEQIEMAQTFLNTRTLTIDRVQLRANRIAPYGARSDRESIALA